ncbi:hypothetical protein F7725_017486 [Dissostichus mawsoni]|uniref:Uncharacterized protein n=1 Tax=Dissostichus mawsoni TaxID=36200 RepID=A0A7J5Z5F0_DISMA|nr:hypothetical protein F7725_017486 [Dissostichus mawsoni]
MISHFYATEPQRVWGCLLVPHLKAGNTEAAGVVGRSDHMNQERAVRDVLLTTLCECFCTGVLSHVGDPQDPSLRSSKEISALLGPSTAMERPPAPASLVQILKLSWRERERYRGEGSRTSCPHLGGSPLSQGPHSELEGAAWHVHTPVPHTHAVHAHLRGNEAHTVGVVARSDQLCRLAGPRGGGDLGGDVLHAIAVNFDRAGVSDLRLDHHDGDGTVGHVTAVLQDADLPLQQAGLVAAGRSQDAGGQQAQVRLMNVQREVCRRAQFDLRAPLVDVVVSGQSGQVADAARPILVVHTADIRFGGTLDGQAGLSGGVLHCDRPVQVVRDQRLSGFT